MITNKTLTLALALALALYSQLAPNYSCERTGAKQKEKDLEKANGRLGMSNMNAELQV